MQQYHFLLDEARVWLHSRLVLSCVSLFSLHVEIMNRGRLLVNLALQDAQEINDSCNGKTLPGDNEDINESPDSRMSSPIPSLTELKVCTVLCVHLHCWNLFGRNIFINLRVCNIIMHDITF